MLSSVNDFLYFGILYFSSDQYILYFFIHHSLYLIELASMFFKLLWFVYTFQSGYLIYKMIYGFKF